MPVSVAVKTILPESFNPFSQTVDSLPTGGDSVPAGIAGIVTPGPRIIANPVDGEWRYMPAGVRNATCPALFNSPVNDDVVGNVPPWRFVSPLATTLRTPVADATNRP